MDDAAHRVGPILLDPASCTYEADVALGREAFRCRLRFPAAVETAVVADALLRQAREMQRGRSARPVSRLAAPRFSATG